MSFADELEKLNKDLHAPELTEARMLRYLMRVVRPHTSEVEFKVLMFIFDRTYTYGKPTECIPYRHFLEGIMLDGEWLAPPLGISLATLKRAIKKLSDNDIIIVRSDRRSNRTYYTINHLFHLRRNVTKRNVTKMAHGRAIHSSPVSHRGLMDEPPIENSENSNMRIRTGSGAALPAGITSSFNNISAKNGAARQKAKSKGSATSYMKIWQDAYREAYPEEQFFAWRNAELAIFKRALERGVPEAFRQPFIEYTVKEFRPIIARQFSWMKNPPQFPTVQFVSKQIERFWQAFEENRDPNRALRGEIQRSEKKVTQPAPSSKELDAVKLELARTREVAERLLKEKRDAEASQRVGRRSEAKKLILKRRKTSDEFGSWD